MSELLSVAIPTYNRSQELLCGLKSFVSQIEKYGLQDKVKIYVSDDSSTDDTSSVVGSIADTYSFIEYQCYPENIGLEKNLIECGRSCKGEFLWIFGDDDFLETPNCLKRITDELILGNEFLVLNRTRRNFQLSEMISDNWMKIDQDHEYSSLIEFFKEWGLISVIGFISVNIFRRKEFFQTDEGKYYGTMYPQLGMMIEAFAQKPCKLISAPMVCHRTQSASEKKAALGDKKTERDFMSDYNKRDALYFGHRFAYLLDHLINKGAMNYSDINQIKEMVFCNVTLLDFILSNLKKYKMLRLQMHEFDTVKIKSFIEKCEPTAEQKIFLESVFPVAGSFNSSHMKIRTISVISPSYNQGEYLSDCLKMVSKQTHPAVEHLIFDPGSTDGSHEIVKQFKHATLIAEPDSGQSDAVNKGFARVGGDIIAWVNSDDFYFDEFIFEKVLKRFNESDQPDIVYGKGIFIDENGDFIRDVYINKNPETLPWRLQQEDGILQPALFIKKSCVNKVGMLSENNHYSMDYEYWIRCVKAGAKFAFIDENFAVARYHKNNKTYGQRANSYKEVCGMIKREFGYTNYVWLKRYAEFLVEGFDGVIQHSGIEQVTDEALVDSKYIGLLKAYNGDYDTLNLLASKASEKGYGDTYREMSHAGLLEGTPCHPIPMNQELEDNCTCYTVAERRWAYNWQWKVREIEKSHAFLKERIRHRRSDVCVIVGNGPSLNDTNLSLLKDADVIISNNAFLSKELAEVATYYTVVNYLVAEQSSCNINRLEGVYKILPFWLSYCLNEGDETFFVDAMGKPEFSTDMLKNMSWRHTVSFYNMHLAYGLGYKKVCLIGFDHNYNQDAAAKEEQVLVCTEDDDNHFHKDYFKGMRWQAADVGKMEEMYALAKKSFEQDSREIVNCTAGGHLELFRRGNLEEELEEVRMDRSQGHQQNGSLIETKPYPRASRAEVDESGLVFAWFEKKKKNGTLFDVGAHHGHVSFPFAEAGWGIHCFEPDPKNREILEQRMKVFGNVRINPVAVSDIEEEGVSFFSSTESTGISSLKSFRHTHEKSCDISITTLSKYLVTNPVDTIDFLKIDAEGFDFHILNGFPWDKYKPSVVLCEFEDLKTIPLGYSYRDMATLLERHGYTVLISEWHPITKYGISHDWCRLSYHPKLLRNQRGWGNLVAFHSPEEATEYRELLEASVLCRNAEVSTADAPIAVSDFEIKIVSATSVDLVWKSDSRNEGFQIFRFYENKWQFLEELKGDVSTRRIELPKPGKYALLVKSVRNGAVIESEILWVNSWTPDTKRAFENKPAKKKQGNKSALIYKPARLAYRGLRWMVSQVKNQPLFHGSIWLAMVALNLSIVFFDSPGKLISAAVLLLLAFSYLFVLGFGFGKLILFEFLMHSIGYMVGPRMRNLEQSFERLQEVKKDVETKNTLLEAKIHGVSAELTASTKKFVELEKKLIEVVSNSKEDIVDFVNKKHESLRELLASELESMRQWKSDLTSSTTYTSMKMDELEVRSTEAMEQGAGKLEEIASRIAISDGKQHSIYQCLSKTGVLNNHHFQHFNRSLNKAHITEIMENWLPILGLESIRPSGLGYMASRICEIESRLQGRLATNVEDMLLRVLVSLANDSKMQNVLEIGSLFGVGLAAIHDASRGRFQFIKIRGLDPLTGYYTISDADSFTNTPVNRTIFDSNLSSLQIAEGEIELIQSLSTDKGVAESIEDHSLSLLIIDGDHSYEGVKVDFELYHKKVSIGGYIIFDDYNSSEWPDVKSYVDLEVRPTEKLNFIGSDWRTIVFRVS